MAKLKLRNHPHRGALQSHLPRVDLGRVFGQVKKTHWQNMQAVQQEKRWGNTNHKLELEH